jgi:hypothetical protein
MAGQIARIVLPLDELASRFGRLTMVVRMFGVGFQELLGEIGV